ncbi:MAG: hypothetical protein [Microvirus sp.]|nr:MAG: hypothetical protein [Microvirus sp.]
MNHTVQNAKEENANNVLPKQPGGNKGQRPAKGAAGSPEINYKGWTRGSTCTDQEWEEAKLKIDSKVRLTPIKFKL